MPRYIPFTKYSIDLINYNDLHVFESFEELEKIGVDRFDKNYIFDKCFNEKDDGIFTTSLMLMFPYLFFMKEDYFDKDQVKLAIKNSTRIKDKINFQYLVFLRLNQNNIYQSLNDISNDGKNDVNTKSFVTTLSKYLYYHSFFTLLKTISFDGETTFIDHLELLLKVQNHLQNTQKNRYVLGLSTKKPALDYFLKEYYQRFRQEFEVEDEVFEQNVSLIKKLNRNPDLSKLLYSSIFFNIKLRHSYSSQKKNSLLRPLFYEVVCRVCYTGFYHKNWDSNDVVQKFRDFLKTYKPSEYQL